MIDADQPGATRPDAAPLAVISRALGVQTNNYAEYTAVVLALDKAIALGAREVELVLDSKLVVEQLAGRWKVRNAGLVPLIARAQRVLAGLERWTIRHEPRAANHAADALANLALDDPAAAARAEAGVEGAGVAFDATRGPDDTLPGPLRWEDFEVAAPELAAAGERLLRGFSVAYLATLRPDGAPRVHPVSVSYNDGGLYVFVIGGSRRAADLARDPRYALHSFPHSPNAEDWDDEEWAIEGTARMVADQAAVERVRATHTDTTGPTDAAYELLVERAHHKYRRAGRRIIRRWPA